MRFASSRDMRASTVYVLDVAVVIWTVVWIALGALVWHDISVQARVTDNLTALGTALQETGGAIGSMGDLPLVGGAIDEAAARVSASGKDVAAVGERSRRAIERAAVVSGAAVALPALFVLLLYAPLRLDRYREVKAVRATLRDPSGRRGVERYLARRALEGRSWAELRQISADPWGDYERGEVGDLAALELRRLGIKERRSGAQPS